MAYNISILTVYFFELLISYFFFNQVSYLKKGKKFSLIIGVLCFGIAAVLNVVFSTIWLNCLTFFLANIILAFLCFDIRIKQSVFYSVVLDIASTSTEYITIFIVSAVSGEAVAYTNDQYTLFLLNAFICKTLYLFICLLLIRFIKKNDTNKKIPVAFYLYPVTVVLVLLFLWNIYTSYYLSNLLKLSISCISTLLLLSIIIIFVSYRNNIDKESRLFSLEREIDKAETDRLYYDILEKQNHSLMVYAHDTKNHLQAIRNMTDDENIIEYLERLTADLNKYSRHASSGNHNLDVIINKYITECEIKGVKFTYDVRKSNLSCVEMYDLVTVLSNLLDNALEAAQKSKDKFIYFQTYRKNSYDVVYVKNSCDNKPDSEGDRLKTTKANKHLHGLGIKSVKTALKNYEGDLNWVYDEFERTFVVTIAFFAER